MSQSQEVSSWLPSGHSIRKIRMQFQARLITKAEMSPSQRDLPDIASLNLPPQAYTSIADLTATYEVCQRLVREVLDKHGVKPIAKSPKRDSLGKTLGGPPAFIYSASEANAAMDSEIENIL